MNETSADKSVATKRAATSSSAVKQVIPSPSAVSSATSSDTRFDDVALIFEGGGMRAAYTAAVVKTLVDAGIVFSKVYGISAGSALSVFYASRNPERARATFVDSVSIKKSHSMTSALEGKGFADLQYIFEGLAEMHAIDDDEWSIDFQQLMGGPTDFHIEAFDMDSGDTKAWTRSDVCTLTDVMVRVMASCAYPLFTSEVVVDGRAYVDGGMGASCGICLDAARADGFKRFFVIRTQMRDYRMKALSLAKREAYKLAYSKHPKVLEALETRPAKYNKLLDELECLRADGSAYVFCPDSMPITYKTVDSERLNAAYEQGLHQCEGELPLWREWLSGCR